MKKLLMIILIIFISCGCSKNNVEEPEFTYEIQYKEVDMSAYGGVNSTNHMFKEILPIELKNVFENNSSGVFYIGYIDCPFCQKCLRYLDQVSREMGVTIYYIDAFNETDPLSGDTLLMVEGLLEKIMQKDEDDDDYHIWTPSVFNVINGEIVNYSVGLPLNLKGDTDWDNPPTEKQIKKLTDQYEAVLKPFVS